MLTHLLPLACFLPPWLSFSLILVAIFPFVGGALILWSEYSTKIKKSLHKRSIVLLAGSLSIIGALVGAIVQARDGYDLWAVSTGAENYCYLRFLTNTSRVLRFAVANNDPLLPVYDVSSDVIDLTDYRELLAQHPNAFAPNVLSTDLIFDWQNQTRVTLQIGSVRPNEVRFLWDVPLPKDALQDYEVLTWARNGYWEEEILVRRRDDGTYVAALRVWRQSRGWFGRTKTESLREEVPGEFKKYYPDKIPWTSHLDN